MPGHAGPPVVPVQVPQVALHARLALAVMLVQRNASSALPDVTSPMRPACATTAPVVVSAHWLQQAARFVPLAM